MSQSRRYDSNFKKVKETFLHSKRLIQHEQKNRLKVSLQEQELTDRDMEIIINKCVNDEQCKELYLGLNKFTSIGVSILADTFNNNQQLESLSLYDNQVCDNGVYFLAKVFRTNAQ